MRRSRLPRGGYPVQPVRFGEHEKLIHERGYHCVRFTTQDNPIPEFEAVDFINKYASYIDVISVTSRGKECFVFFKSRVPND